MAKNTEARFTKEQLLRSRRYGDRRDVLEAILDAKGTYSHADVIKRIGNFMKGGVK